MNRTRGVGVSCRGATLPAPILEVALVRLRPSRPLAPLLALALLCPSTGARAVSVGPSSRSVGGTPSAPRAIASVKTALSMVYDQRPSSEQIAAARARIGGRRLFVQAGSVDLEFARCRLDTLGIHFGPGEPRAAAAIDSAGEAHPLRREWLPLSPLAWERVDQIAVARPRGIEGAVAGGGLGLVAVIAWGRAALEADGSADLGLAAPWLVGLPIGSTLLGATLGSLNLKRVPVMWRNATPLESFEWRPGGAEGAEGAEGAAEEEEEEEEEDDDGPGAPASPPAGTAPADTTRAH